MSLSPQADTFVERMGVTFESLGATRTAGRLIGLLLLADRPLGLGELADRLRVSKASISTNARLVEQIGMVTRVGLPGDRRDYYEIRPNSFENMVARRMARIGNFIELTDEGLRTIEPGNVAARRRLEAMRAFYTFFLDELDATLARWRERHRPSPGTNP
ncbi:MAG: MarR family transcriptional regulator [Candidatus Eiseniibacteriota bacterium]|jgi:DNA-binding transcriptional regulator GbsR (MarR family)